MNRSNQNLSCFKFTIFSLFMSHSFSDTPRTTMKIFTQFWAHKEIKTQSVLKLYAIGGLVLFCFAKESKILINWTENTPLKKTHVILLPRNNSWFYFEAACSWAGISTDDAKRKLTQREGSRKSITLLTHHSCFQQPSCYWAVFWLIFVWCFHLFILIFFPKVLSCKPERIYF